MNRDRESDRVRSLLHSAILPARGARTVHEQHLYSRVVETIHCLCRARHSIAIATNQSDVATGTITIGQAVNLIEHCAKMIGGIAAYRFSAFDSIAPKTLRGKPNQYALSVIRA